MSRERDDWFGGLVPAWVQFVCPTYYLGVVLSAIYVVPFVAMLVVCTLICAIGRGFTLPFRANE